MLSHRIATAAVLVPLALAVVILLPAQFLAWVLGAVALGAAYEWAGLAGFSATEERSVYAALIFLVMLAVAYFMPPWLPSDSGMIFLAAVVLCWCVAISQLVDYQAGRELPFGSGFVAAAGVITIVSAWYALISTQALPHGGYLYVILLFLLVWAADIGAFFAGQAFGSSKLAARISPGKTWAGVWGGVAAALLIMLLLGPLFGLSLIKAVALLLPTLLLAVVGDLYESLLKRRAGLKDSGALLPGHGGLLDRVDSLLAAAPAFAFIARILESFV